MKYFEPPSFQIGANVGHLALSLSSVAGQVGFDRIIVPLFWTKQEVPHQIKLRIPKSKTILRVRSTICIVFICVCYAENGNYRVVSAGQLSFGKIRDVFCM